MIIAKNLSDIKNICSLLFLKRTYWIKIRYTFLRKLEYVLFITLLLFIYIFFNFQNERPKKCNNPKVCNLWHKSGVRYMRTCQPCPDVYPWTGKSGVRNSRVDNEIINE